MASLLLVRDLHILYLLVLCRPISRLMALAVTLQTKCNFSQDLNSKSITHEYKGQFIIIIYYYHHCNGLRCTAALNAIKKYFRFLRAEYLNCNLL